MLLSCFGHVVVGIGFVGRGVEMEVVVAEPGTVQVVACDGGGVDGSGGAR
jgi:hypothetical protein